MQAAAVGRGLPESISSVREKGADGVSSSRDRVPDVLGKYCSTYFIRNVLTLSHGRK